MMRQFSDHSHARLETCHKDLQKVLNLALQAMDFSVLEGYRTSDRQEYLFEQGLSQVRAGGKHNQLPSLAVDVAPYPIDWGDTERFVLLAGIILGVAAICDVNIRWGGDWNQNMQTRDETFRDLGHFELMEV